MGKITLESEAKNSIIKITVEGTLTVEQMNEHNRATREMVKIFRGRPFGVLVDLREMKPFSQEATEGIKENQAILMEAGLRKSAEIVATASAMLQLNRVARESGLSQILQRFTDFAAAREWLAQNPEA